MKVYVLQHAEPETPGLIAGALHERGIRVETIRSYAGEPVPSSMAERDGLVVMGGPMGVYEQSRYPFLREEIDLIRDALRVRKPVLGVCLGSQLLAAALGAHVAPGRKEIGWYPVSLTEAAARDPLWRDAPQTFEAFHWHGDVFDLPPDSVLLARSDLTPVQAFRSGQAAYGLVFHMEMDEPMVRAMVETFDDELSEAGGDAGVVLARTHAAVREMERVGRVVFGRWADAIGRKG